MQYLVSTGRHHGFESLGEERYLPALDFTGGVTDAGQTPCPISQLACSVIRACDRAR